MRRALQPQGDGTWLFLRDGEPIWSSSDFEEFIEVARIDSMQEVEKMIAAEVQHEPYEYEHGTFRVWTNHILDFWFRMGQLFAQRFKR